MNDQSYGWRSIRLRLFLLFALVIAAVLFYALRDVMTQWHTRDAMERGAQYSALSVQINGLVHELQKERGLSAGFIGSRGGRFKAELETQRQDTDKARAALDAWLAGAERAQLSGAIEKSMAAAQARLAELQATRGKVTVLGLPGQESFNYYTGTIERLVAVIDLAASAAEEIELSRGMNAYLMFVLAKEQAGRERASINGLFAADAAADVALHRRIVTILTAQDTYLANFRSTASQPWIEGLQTVLDSDVGLETARLRQAALDRMDSGSFGVEPAHWFTTITRKIDLLKVEEDRFASELLDRARMLSGDSATRFALSVAMTLAVLVAAVLFGLQVTGLLRGLRGNATAAHRIAQGKLDEKIEVHNQNELGEIERALAEVQFNLHAMIDDASLLSKAAVEGRLATRADASRHQGDYARIVQGVNDTLDAVIGPLNVAAAYVDQIARGAIPAKITDTYNGDFNTIKNNLNTAIDAVNGLVADAVMLAQAAVEGRLETRADAGKHQGDYRRIVEGVNATLDAVIAPINEVKRVMVALSGGDLTQKITDDYAGDFQVLQNAVNDSMDKLAEIIEQVRGAADALTNAAGQVSATAQSLSQSSSEQAASVEETSASIEQMSASINQNSENAKITDAMASKSSAEAGEGGQAVKSTVEAMKNIAGKIGIIDDIAYQTNLLALNAAIEAARAGEHGKGFAVVAAEVRKLAERSQVAAQEIGELASGSVNLAERAGKLLDEMVPSINKTSDLVQEIASASQEQTAGVGQINNAMGQLNKATQQNASASEELAATAKELGGQAGQLQELMDFFTVDSASGARRR
ncbi:nitrate- and nitrite sensing domain-containing protein [Thauera sp.]|uniref:methyl-accepting chemotaxis protein n=1 Tax=Thauera sp. TaxID=1905334 RepID=UPI002C7E403E|nr:nitrate- and nitrite sensing domain-containing protein [Thauera sp.]HRO37843.1 nitrate- and nitrite sensing domain-containing protein [Thauera sp.]